MRLIIHMNREWLPQYGAFQTRWENGTIVGRHILSDYLVSNFKNIAAHIYNQHGLVQAESDGYWIYFR